MQAGEAAVQALETPSWGETAIERKPVRTLIPIAHPCFDGNEKKYVGECLDTAWISSTGRFIGQFERTFADFCGAAHGVSTNNGTSALHLALLGLGVSPGDEVIIPTLTYVATANAVRYCGALPVLVDSEWQTMNLDPAKIEQLITPRTKGIIAVHLFGHPADMNPILDLARRYGVFVLEDAAEAHGAIYKGQRVGSLGDAATFSFYGNKIVTTGEGGMVTSDDAEFSARIRILRGQGMDPDRRYWFPEIGYNYRMTNVAAAIGLGQTERIGTHLDKRRRVAGWYKSVARRLDHSLELPVEQPWARHAFWAYPVLLRNTVSISRDALMDALMKDNIETRPIFYPMHVLPPYYEPNGHYPIADDVSRRGILLPMHGLVTEDDVFYIAERVAHHCTL
jgi:perosamine synthetase